MSDQLHLTLAEAALYLRFDATAPAAPQKACLQYLKRAGIPMLHRGRTLLIEKRVLDGYLAGKVWTKRRAG